MEIGKRFRTSANGFVLSGYGTRKNRRLVRSINAEKMQKLEEIYRDDGNRSVPAKGFPLTYVSPPAGISSGRKVLRFLAGTTIGSG